MKNCEFMYILSFMKIFEVHGKYIYVLHTFHNGISLILVTSLVNMQTFAYSVRVFFFFFFFFASQVSLDI